MPARGGHRAPPCAPGEGGRHPRCPGAPLARDGGAASARLVRAVALGGGGAGGGPRPRVPSCPRGPRGRGLSPQISSKRSSSFKRAIANGQRALPRDVLLDETGLGIYKRFVRYVAYEILPCEMDRRWYFYQHRTCPPPVFMAAVTLTQVRGTGGRGLETPAGTTRPGLGRVGWAGCELLVHTVGLRADRKGCVTLDVTSLCPRGWLRPGAVGLGDPSRDVLVLTEGLRYGVKGWVPPVVMSWCSWWG